MLKVKINQSGSMLIVVIVTTGLFLTVSMGTIALALLEQKLNIRKVAHAQALHIAEAGVNYYRWVLYHDSEEYCNKEACQGAPDYGPYGPYIYKDSSGQNIFGYYELYITPPPLDGSTIVGVRSVGWVANYPNVKRTIEVQVGIPSWTTYATMTDGSDADLSYGVGSEVWGPVHSNYGCVYFDGIANNIVTSSQPGCGNDFGVNTCRDGCDPNWDGNNPPQNLPIPERPNFRGGRDMGSHIPIISFNFLSTEYLNSVYVKATTSGLVFDPRDTGTADPDSEPAFWDCLSGGTCLEGFHIALKAGNKFDISMVSSQVDRTIQTESGSTEYTIPDNGIVFVKHTAWVGGQVNNGASGTRITILAFKDPISTDSDGDINITDSILYTNYDGSDTIGLVAQRHVAIGRDCDDPLRIDAALLAKSGRRYCPNYGVPKKSKLTIYGHTASYLKPYTSSCFTTREYIYDNNLTFGPPPHYPTTGEYTFISWKEQ